MGCSVFVNNNEISCKASGGKVIAAFPDTCLSPPTPPAGPVPIPYPVTSFASDCSDGSTTVKVNGQPVMLKDQSYFSKCTGDEAATKSLGMGVVSHNIQGKVYFVAWSMDVKIEGKNADRHLDLMTSNHSSPLPDVAPIPECANMIHLSRLGNCKCEYDREKCKPPSPTKVQTAQVNPPNESKCWRPNCRTPDATPFIADHQPSLVERWYRLGGCNMGSDPADSQQKFCDYSRSTGYRSLKPRCQGCYQNTWNNTPPRKRVGRKRWPERSMEARKGGQLRKKVKERFGTDPQPC
jgi:hypothetical protein